MIQAMIFDLDGTLVQSEKLKARSYAIAVQRLRGLAEPDPRAIEAYREIVGASRDVASQHIVDRLGLDADLRPLLERFGVAETREVLTNMRKKIYDDIVADPQVIRDNQWPHSVELLQVARTTSCRTGLATMSYRKEVDHVLRALGLEKLLDVVLTREDVKSPKPDPEIYSLAARRLGVEPEDCIVIEDSPNGVRAAAAARMNVVALATPFTTAGLHADELIEHAWVVDDAERLVETVEDRIVEHGRGGHS